MAVDRGETLGPSWADVSTLMGHLEKAFHGRCRYVTGRKVVGKDGLAIDVEFLRARGRNDWYVVAYLTRYWPTHQARTMPGLLVQALWALEESVIEYDALPLFRNDMPEATLPHPPAEP